jgi:hypothetical protein
LQISHRFQLALFSGKKSNLMLSKNNFSRALASYSLLSSSKNKKYRLLLLKKNFWVYSNIRLKFKYDLYSLFIYKFLLKNVEGT